MKPDVAIISFDEMHEWDPNPKEIEKQFVMQFDTNDDVTQHKLCHRCQYMFSISSFVECLSLLSPNFHGPVYLRKSWRPCESFSDNDGHCQKLPYHKSFNDLETAYLDGCHLCTTVWHSLQPEDVLLLRAANEDYLTGERKIVLHLHVTEIAINDNPCSPKSDSNEQSFSATCSSSEDLASPDSGDSKEVHLEALAIYLLVQFGLPDTNNVRLNGKVLSTNEESLCWWKDYESIGLSISTSSDSSFVLVRKWVSHCIENHSSCRRLLSRKAQLPTRLVFVGPPREPKIVRLCETRSLPPGTEYATLSHVWGPKSLFKLTTKNMESLKQQISEQDLPPKFQDAFHITRQLGLEYIWIDSLCIIQDSSEDWSREAPTMARIYGRTTCNINILSSGEQGCFRLRNPLKVRPCVVFKDDSFSLTFKRADPYLLQHDPPLLTRAWVMQERLLAPRNVYFGDFQIFWECCVGVSSEDDPKSFSKTSDMRCLKPIKLFFEVIVRNGGHKDDDNNTAQMVKAWNTVIERYSNLKLTRGSDRIVAFSGLAEIVTEIYPLTYVAGMWKETFPKSLLWHAWTPGEKLPISIIPSWSWASTNSPSGILMQPPELTDPMRVKLTYQTEVFLFHSRTTSGCSSKDVKSNFLLLRGFLIPMRLTCPGAKDAYLMGLQHPGIHYATAGGGTYKFKFEADIPVSFVEELWFYLVYSYNYKNPNEAPKIRYKHGALSSFPVQGTLRAKLFNIHGKSVMPRSTLLDDKGERVQLPYGELGLVLSGCNLSKRNFIRVGFFQNSHDNGLHRPAVFSAQSGMSKKKVIRLF